MNKPVPLHGRVNNGTVDYAAALPENSHTSMTNIGASCHLGPRLTRPCGRWPRVLCLSANASVLIDLGVQLNLLRYRNISCLRGSRHAGESIFMLAS
jgi:hypothetical protein